MIFLNKESIYENDLVKQSKVDWQEKKYSKCPLCPADISNENVSCITGNRKRHHQNVIEKLSDRNFSIPATLLNGGILNITGCGFPGVQKNSDKLKFKRKNSSKLETCKGLCRHKRVIEPDAMLGPKRTFPCSGCPINMLPFTVKKNCEKDNTLDKKKHLSKNSLSRAMSKTVSVGSGVSGQNSKRKKFKILENGEHDVKKTKSSSLCKRTSRSSSRRSRIKRHHSLLSVRKRRHRHSSTPTQVKMSVSVETQVSIAEEENHQKPIPRASNRSSKNILNCTYENKSSQIEDDIPSLKGQQVEVVDPVSKRQGSIERGGSSLENIRECSMTMNSVSEVLNIGSNQVLPNVAEKNVQLENNDSVNDFRRENSVSTVENNSLHLKSSLDVSIAEQSSSFDQIRSQSNAMERSADELANNSLDQQEESSARSESCSFPEGFIDNVTMRNNYIDDAINKAKTHDFLHEFYKVIGNEEFDREMLDDDSDEDLKQRSDDQLIIIDSSASDVHEDNPIMSDDEKRVILEEMVGPRINYFKFDSETDNDDSSPCGKYLNKLPQVFRIKTNGDLKKFEIENIVRQYRYSYLVRIMNKCPKPDLRLRRCRRSDRSERFYIDSSLKNKRLSGRSEHSKLQYSSSRRLVKRNALCDKKMKKELGPATIWNGPTPSRRKLEAPKFCQTLDFSALFDLQNESKQAQRSKLSASPPVIADSEDPGLLDNVQSTSKNLNSTKKHLFMGDMWNILEMDCVQNYLKTCATQNDDDLQSESKVNLPKPSDTKGKVCPFSPWPCPLGPMCPFPPDKNDDEEMRKEAGPCLKTDCPNRSDLNVLPDIPDVIKEITKFNDYPFLDIPECPLPWLPGNAVKKVKSVVINKVSIGTVTSSECVILPKCRLFKRKKRIFNREELAEQWGNDFKTRRRSGESRLTKSEYSMAKKISKYLCRHRKSKTYHALKLSSFPEQVPGEGHISNNNHLSTDDTCVQAYHPGRRFEIRDRRNSIWKRAGDSPRYGRFKGTSSEDIVKVKRHNDLYHNSARKIKTDHFEDYPQIDYPTEEYSEYRQSSEDRLRMDSDRETPLRRKNDFLPIRKYDIKNTSLSPVRYQQSSSSDIRRSTRETRLRVNSFKARNNEIPRRYQALPSNSVFKQQNGEFGQRNSSHLFRDDFFNELSFYADPHFPKPNFISYNTSLYHRRSHISCLPPSVASKIILNTDKCMFKNPVFLSESANACASLKGQDRSRVKRASGRHVSHDVDYF